MKIKKIIKRLIYYFKTIIIFKIIKNKKFAALRRIADSSDYLENKRKTKSVVFWTTHKCASTYISKFLDLVSKESELRHFDYAGHIWELGNEIKIENPFDIETNNDFLYREYGEIYGPMRTPFDFNLRDQLNNIFFLRDPRDLIISLFYSIAYSHPVPSNEKLKKKFLKKRNFARKIGLNSFFLKQIDEWVIPYYTKYKFMRENSKLASFYKYEDLKKDPKKIFLSISKKMKIRITDKLIDHLVDSFEKPFRKNSKKKIKDKFSHTRSGESRQFEREIKKNVLIKANKKISKIIKYWDYKV